MTSRVPAGRRQRQQLRAAARRYVAERRLVPPLAVEELRRHARAIAGRAHSGHEYHDFTTVLIGNEVWRDTVAAVPYERRILLLPQCLRARARCPAPVDELGLRCQTCGQCPIGALQREAEQLGYVVLVAEGTTVVTTLLEQGKVDAVVGVSCLAALERSFGAFATQAIPGLAIPLLRDGCDCTAVDLDWVSEAIQLHSDEVWLGRLDLEALRAEVDSWFTPANLAALLCRDAGATGALAVKWLRRGGKRWRPLLCVAMFKALQGLAAEPTPALRRLAVAVECFHKASLVHDDIEDNDLTRYGEPTLHRQHGIPIALNTGDFLLGEGYRLIATAGLPPPATVRMLAAAASGHRTLCLGQGEELAWVRQPGPLTAAHVIEIFRQKTAPAFEVALTLGAIGGGAEDGICRLLGRFSQALGIAYQIRDDLEDCRPETADSDLVALRPSIVLALASESAAGAARGVLAAAWHDAAGRREHRRELGEIVQATGATEKARQLFNYHKNAAIRCLHPLRQADVKSLLYRLTERILGRV